MHILLTVYFFVFLLVRHASEVGLVMFAALGIAVLLVPSMRLRALSSVSGWQRQDSWMALALTSVFLFKLLSSAWSASPQLGLSNAVWHLHFAAWPLLVLAMLYCIPKLNDILSGLSIALIVTGVWMAWSVVTGKAGYYPLVFKINPGVLAEMVLVCGSLLIVAAITPFQSKGKLHTALYALGALGAVLTLHSTGRRTEWIGFFVILCLLGIWTFRHKLTFFRALLALVCFVTALIAAFYLKQDRFLLAYREVVHYFTMLGVDSSAAATSVGARLEMYRLGLTAFWHNPFFGMGSGVRPYLLQAYGGLSEAQLPHRHFHSEFLQVLVEGGIVWALALSAAIAYWFRQAVFAIYQQSNVLALMAAFLSFSFMLAGSISAGLIYGPANATLVMFSALIWVCIRQGSTKNATQ